MKEREGFDTVVLKSVKFASAYTNLLLSVPASYYRKEKTITIVINI